MRKTSRTDRQISFRLPDDDLKLVEQAAAIRGTTVAQFAAHGAVLAAIDVVLSQMPKNIVKAAIAKELTPEIRTKLIERFQTEQRTLDRTIKALERTDPIPV